MKPTSSWPPPLSKTAWTFPAPTPSSSTAPTASASPISTSFAGASAAPASAPMLTFSFRRKFPSLPWRAAVKEFSELGAGFRIAALDLELRGAGNLLGREQHGHVTAIGFDLYCQMLERAVARLKGQQSATELRTTLNLGLDVRIPPDYIPGENLRLRTYKRISTI